MYQHILFALELDSKQNYLAAQKIKQLAELFQAKLSLLHVVEVPDSGVYTALFYDKQSCIEHAKQQVAELGKKLGVPLEDQYVECGNPKELIPEYMKELKVNLLVVGHHERHGLYHLLGSTSYAALSHAKCDVLTIPYPKYD